jgi:CRP/FNR family cyclic AMP-dependent transcriptional regulator
MPKKTNTTGGSSKSVGKIYSTGSDVASLLTSIRVGQFRATVEANNFVFRQGEPADAVFYIERGRIKLTVISEHGREGVIAILDAGEFFGEGCLAGQPLRMASAAAMSDSVIIKIDIPTMKHLLRDESKLCELFIAFLLARNIQFEGDLVDHLFNSSERRLARLLLLLANFNKNGQLEPVIPKINQEVLAARVGTTRSRVNYFMNKFRSLGYIEYSGRSNGRLKVHSSLLNIIVQD